VGTVYALIDPRYDLIRYIGQTAGPLRVRLGHHLSDARRPGAGGWIADVLAAGLLPVCAPVRVDVPTDQLLAAESAEIARHLLEGWPLVNVDLGTHVAGLDWVTVLERRVERLEAAGDPYAADLVRAAIPEQLRSGARRAYTRMLVAIEGSWWESPNPMARPVLGRRPSNAFIDSLFPPPPAPKEEPERDAEEVREAKGRMASTLARIVSGQQED
jgi:hypothetical protein